MTSGRLLALTIIGVTVIFGVAMWWATCYDADPFGSDLEAGAATALLGRRDITRGVDRVVAIYPDGRAFAWHQVNGTLE